MVKIRLTRIGKKNEPHFRIVVIPSRTKRDSKAIEYLGYYNPRTKEIKLNVERAKYWLSIGAQPTDTVIGFLAKHKLVKPLPRPDRPPKKPKKELKKEKAEETKVEPKKEVNPEGQKAESKDVVQAKEESPKETKDKKEEEDKPSIEKVVKVKKDKK